MFNSVLLSFAFVIRALFPSFSTVWDFDIDCMVVVYVWRLSGVRIVVGKEAGQDFH